MTPTPFLEDLVRAICDGRSIDWTAIEQNAPPGFSNKLAALSVVERIARVHRTAVPEPAAIDEAPAFEPAAAPRRWGPLELLDSLASGAFGDVYRAWDPGLDREVALKLLRRSIDADAHADEVLEEGRLLAKVKHPNVVTVYGAARFDGRAGIWMEFVHGRTLAEIVRQDGPLPRERVASIGVALCHALSTVHAAGLVHRDVKPQNVMIADDGRVVLMDFGAGSTVRHAGLQLAGTPLYLAPEVAAGGPVTLQSDIYSLGVTLQHVFCANHPVSAGIQTRTRADRQLLAVIGQATNPEPLARFQSAEAFARALTTSGRPVNVPGVAVAAGLMLALFAILTVTWRLPAKENAAQRELAQSWESSRPIRAALTVDQSQLPFGSMRGTFVSRSVATIDAVTQPGYESIVTLDPAAGGVRTWTTNASADGRAESPAVSADQSMVTYNWRSTACQCASLRAVDLAGRTRTLIAAPDIVAIRTGATTSSVLPVLIARAAMRYELALVDTATGVTRTLTKLSMEPGSFSLSPDGAYLALAMPTRAERGSASDIVIHEVATSREWPLLDSAADRVLPVWAPSANYIVYFESSGDRGSLRTVRVVSGHASSRPSVLRHEFVTPSAMGFLNDRTFAYANSTGTGDVMVVEASADGTFSGRSPRRVNHEAAMMPAWSPDGRWLAWSENNGIRITKGDDTNVRTLRPELSTLVYPTWSPDSTRVAYWDVSVLGAILRVADFETGTTREILRLSHPEIFSAYDLAWSTAHELVLDALDPRRLFAVDALTGTRREFHDRVPSSIPWPHYVSPDGHSVAFCEGPENAPAPIHIVPLDRRGISLIHPVAGRPGEALMGWWPDNRSLLETRRGPDGLPMSAEFWRLPLDGTAPERLGVTGTNVLYASIAPDGRRLAYTSQTFGGELWLLTAELPR